MVTIKAGYNTIAMHYSKIKYAPCATAKELINKLIAMCHVMTVYIRMSHRMYCNHQDFDIYMMEHFNFCCDETI